MSVPYLAGKGKHSAVIAVIVVTAFMSTCERAYCSRRFVS